MMKSKRPKSKFARRIGLNLDFHSVSATARIKSVADHSAEVAINCDAGLSSGMLFIYICRSDAVKLREALGRILDDGEKRVQFKHPAN